LVHAIAVVNRRAPRPHRTPSKAAPARSRKSNGGDPFVANRGSVPANAAKVTYDAAAAMPAGTSIRRARSSWYGTSSANTSPVAGALKMAATPAAAIFKDLGISAGEEARQTRL
jgi:hypothetical protein